MLMDERPPLVTFETRAIENRSESMKLGHYAFTDVDFVMVMPAGGKDVFEDRAENWLKKQEQHVRDGRVPREHNEYFKRQYAAFKEGGQEVIDGTAIKLWTVASPAQQKAIIQANILSVEDLAVAPDDALSAIGMGARALQNKARTWLESAKGPGVATARITDLEIKLQETLALISKQNEYIQSLESRMEQLGEPEAKRRGRPPNKPDIELEI